MSLAAYLELKKNMEAQLAEIAKSSIFKDFFLGIFAKYPTVQAIRWQQYAPHFNDGDACVFTVHEPEAWEAETEEDDEKWQGTWGDNKTLSAVTEEVQEFFNDIQEVLEQAFGDGYQITVQKNGDIEVEEYDHD